MSELSKPFASTFSVRAVDDEHIAIETDYEIITINAVDLVHRITKAIRERRLAENPTNPRVA